MLTRGMEWNALIDVITVVTLPRPRYNTVRDLVSTITVKLIFVVQSLNLKI